MTQSDLQPDVAVEAAARWIASRDQTGTAIVPEARNRFGLSTAQAVEACRLASKISGGANASGS